MRFFAVGIIIKDSTKFLLTDPQTAQREWTHHLFPSTYRQRAYEVFNIGLLLSSSPLFRGEGQSLRDVWLFCVMPYAISRHT